jgi:D-methionine transport system ATP-binding protein
VIELRGLGKTFHSKNGAHEVLKDIDLIIRDGDIFGIIGLSGAGKSTLVRCINLLEKPTEGRVVIDGVDVTDFKGRQLLDLRARIGMIFQDFNLFAQRNVLQNVLFPLEVRHDRREDAMKRARELLDLVGLTNMEDRYPAQLSGGQQQRVSIARALANHPDYLLCDEATSALDSLTTVSILSLIKQINRDLGVTVIVITHAMAVIREICNRVAVIDGTRIVETGKVANVFCTPEAAITKELVKVVSIDA